MVNKTGRSTPLIGWMSLSLSLSLWQWSKLGLKRVGTSNSEQIIIAFCSDTATSLYSSYKKCNCERITICINVIHCDVLVFFLARPLFFLFLLSAIVRFPPFPQTPFCVAVCTETWNWEARRSVVALIEAKWRRETREGNWQMAGKRINTDKDTRWKIRSDLKWFAKAEREEGKRLNGECPKTDGSISIYEVQQYLYYR